MIITQDAKSNLNSLNSKHKVEYVVPSNFYKKVLDYIMKKF